MPCCNPGRYLLSVSERSGGFRKMPRSALFRTVEKSKIVIMIHPQSADSGGVTHGDYRVLDSILQGLVDEYHRKTE